MQVITRLRLDFDQYRFAWTVALAAYLALKYFALMPDADAYFASTSASGPLAHWLLAHFFPPFMALSSLGLIFGRFQSVLYFILWSGQVILYFDHPEAVSPEIGVLGFLLIMRALGPLVEGEKVTLQSWLVSISLVQLYLNAGTFKILDPMWRAGEGVRMVFNYPGFRYPELLSNPVFASPPVLMFLSYAVMCLYFAIPLSLVSRRLAINYHFIMIVFHALIWLLTGLTQVSVGMILVHSWPLVSFRLGESKQAAGKVSN